MKKIIVLLLILVLSLKADPVIKYSFNRTNNTINLTFDTKQGYSYTVARYDIKNEAYDVYTNFTATANSTNTVTVNPMLPSDEDQLPPSGQCYFYLIEHGWN